MNFSLTAKHFRLYRGGIALIVSLAAVGFGLAFLAVVLAHLLGFLSISNWHELAWAGSILVLLSTVPIALFRESIGLMMNNGRGLRAYQQARFAESEAIFRESLRRTESWSANDPCRGEVLGHLVRVARAQGNYDDAESFAQQWVTACEQVWGSHHAYTLLALEELAEVYLTLARLSAAQPLLEQSLARREANGDRATIETARCLHRLGALSLDQDRVALAESHLRRGYDIATQLQVKTSPDGLALLRSLVVALLASDKVDEAASLAEAAPADEMLTLALVRAAQNRMEDAERLTRESLSLAERTLGANRPELRDCHRLLGVILQAKSQWNEAEKCYQRALALCEDFLSPIHPDLAAILEQYAGLLMNMGRVLEAENHALRARQIRDFHVHN